MWRENGKVYLKKKKPVLEDRDDMNNLKCSFNLWWNMLSKFIR